MAVEEANSQLGVAMHPPRVQLPLSPRSLIGSSGSGASTPDGGGSPMGGKAKRGREVAGSSLLRPRKLIAEPDPVPDVDALKPEELWAMLLREREARDFYRKQVSAAPSPPPVRASSPPHPTPSAEGCSVSRRASALIASALPPSADGEQCEADRAAQGDPRRAVPATRRRHGARRTRARGPGPPQGQPQRRPPVASLRVRPLVRLHLHHLVLNLSGPLAAPGQRLGR